MTSRTGANPKERTTTSSRRPTGAAAKSPSLAAEAADMEAKLLELRKAMELERAKREGKGADGNHWRTGAAGYKPTVRSKSGTPLPPVSHLGGGTDTPAGGTQNVQRWTADMDVRPAAAASAASGRVSASSSRPDSGGQVMQRPGQLLPPRNPLARLDNPAMNVRPPSQDQSQHSNNEPSLAEGAFNEADSHGSFLDALNEWRAANRANKGENPQGEGHARATAAAAPSTSRASKQQDPHHHHQQQQQEIDIRSRPSQAHSSSNQGQDAASSSNASGMQTEIRNTSRPASASKPVTYFNRLVLNSASRQAGHAASTSSSSSAMQAGPLDMGLSATTSGGQPLVRRSSNHLPPLTSPTESMSQVYAVETAMTSPQSTAGSTARHRGLDILEELERLELKQHQAQQYDSDEEWAALLSPRQHGQSSRRQQQQDQLVVTTQQGMMGLTKGVRLPDAILLPQPDSDDEQS